MANSKISALTSATTPLAGTETLPVVQSSATKKVAVSDLTVGRTVGMNYAEFVNGFSIKTGGVNRWLVQKDGTDDLYFYRYDNAGSYAGNPLVISRSNGDVTFENNFVQKTASNGINFSANTAAAGKTSQLLNWYEEGTWTPADNSGAVTITVNSATYVRIGRLVTLQMDITYPTTTSGAVANIKNVPFTPANNNGGGVYCNSANGITGLQVTTGSLIYFQTTAGNNATNVQLTGNTIRTSFSYQV